MNSLGKFLPRITAIVIATAAALGSINASAVENAKPSANAVNSVTEKTCTASKTSSKAKNTTSSPEMASLIKSTNSKVKENKFRIHGNAKYLNFDNTKVTTVEGNKGEKFNLVTIPYKNEAGYNYISNVTITYKYGDNSSPISQSETIYTKSKNDKFTLTEVKNGKIIKNDEIDIDYIDGATLQAKQNTNTPDPNTPELQDWKAKTACLGAILGVNGVVAALIASTCTTACAAEPVGAAVCAACIGGIAAVGAADIGGVIECFKL